MFDGTTWKGEQFSYNQADSVLSINQPNIAISLFVKSGSTASHNKFYPMVREATETDSTYEPYKGKTYTIQLGDTIYGGELDVITGKMVVDRALKTYTGASGEGWVIGWDGTRVYRCAEASISDGKIESQQRIGIKGISDKYQWVSFDYGAECMWNIRADETEPSSAFAIRSTGSVYVKDTRYASVSDFITYLASNPLQVCYELAEPYTIQLTPQQIRMLKGTNNLSCNTGDLTIKYYPDNVLGQLKGDIEKGLNAYYDYQIQALWDKIEELQS